MLGNELSTCLSSLTISFRRFKQVAYMYSIGINFTVVFLRLFCAYSFRNSIANNKSFDFRLTIQLVSFVKTFTKTENSGSKRKRYLRVRITSLFVGCFLIAFTVKRVPFPALSNVLCSRTENAESPIRDNYMTCVFILIGAKFHVSARAFFDRR